MEVTRKNVFNNPKRDEINYITNNTIEEYIQKDDDCVNIIEYKYNIQFYDKLNKTKNRTKKGVQKTIVASNEDIILLR